MKILKMIKIDYRDRRIIRELYKHQTTSIKIEESKKEAAIRKEVRQACKLTPLLFNIYIEKVINKFKEFCTGMKMNGVRIQMLSFTDDIAIIAEDEINPLKPNGPYRARTSPLTSKWHFIYLFNKYRY
jgi:hypothetical protein